MLTVISIVLILAAVVLILVVLAQNPKGGGLSATFGGSNQIIGARQTADFLEKATWYIAIGILVVVLASNFFIPNQRIQEQQQSLMSEQIEEMANPIPANPNPDAALPTDGME